MTSAAEPLDMTPEESRALRTAQLSRNWWAIVLRGLVNIAFGVFLIVWPIVTTYALILAFAAYAIADGILEIVAAVRAAARHERWGSLLLSGLLSIAAGVVAALLPETAVFALLSLVAAWAVLSGILMLRAAFAMERTDGRWWMAICGVVSVLFGIALSIVLALAFLSPPPQMAAIFAFLLVPPAILLGYFSIAFGAFLTVLGFRLRARGTSLVPRTTPATSPAAPARS